MYDFPLRKAMKETCCNKFNNNNKSSNSTNIKKNTINNNNKNNINKDGRGTNEFGHGALHRAVINDEERTIQRYTREDT